MVESLLRQIAGWEAYLAACEAAGNVFEADCTAMHLDDLRDQLLEQFLM